MYRSVSVAKKQRAGIIPFFKSNNKILMLFMKPSDSKYGGEEFQIAKGRIDDGENPLDAAVRESNEELGLKPTNIKWIKKSGLFLGNHHIYIAEVHSMDRSAFGPVTFETGDTKWMELDEFLDIGRPLHKSIVKKSFDFFGSILSDN